MNLGATLKKKLVADLAHSREQRKERFPSAWKDELVKSEDVSEPCDPSYCAGPIGCMH